MTRLLNPVSIPECLWDSKDNALVIPRSLGDAYIRIVDQRGLRLLAESRNPKNPPVGGISQKASDIHFAQAFDGSVARALLALLDPHHHLSDVSNALIKAIAGNSLCIIDAPCGAGATSYALLAALADLRASNVLPRVPLDVKLIGADLSDPARAYAEQLLHELSTQLADQGIFVSAEFRSWDATDKMSTTSLIQRSIEVSANGKRRLVLVANFNAFLEREGKRKESEQQIEELLRYASGPHCVAFWIEPSMNRVTSTGGVFAWIIKKLKAAWKSFAALLWSCGTGLSFLVSEARFRRPIRPTDTPRVHLAIMAMRLEQQK